MICTSVAWPAREPRAARKVAACTAWNVCCPSQLCSAACGMVQLQTWLLTVSVIELSSKRSPGLDHSPVQMTQWAAMWKRHGMVSMNKKQFHCAWFQKHGAKTCFVLVPGTRKKKMKSKNKLNMIRLTKKHPSLHQYGILGGWTNDGTHLCNQTRIVIFFRVTHQSKHSSLDTHVLQFDFTRIGFGLIYRNATLNVADHWTCGRSWNLGRFNSADVPAQIVRNGCSITVLPVIWMCASHFLPSWQIWNHANAMQFTCHKQPAGFLPAHHLLLGIAHHIQSIRPNQEHVSVFFQFHIYI